jgi:hypothetical protein
VLHVHLILDENPSMTAILGQTGGLLILLGSVLGQQDAAKKAAHLNELSLEVAALQILHDLELTPAQLSALAKLARESAPAAKPRESAKASPGFTAALTSLHGALARGDDNQIGEAREKLDLLMQKEEPELDDGIAVTESARSNAAEAIKILNVRQVGVFLGTLELTDPAELLITALDQVRKLSSSKEVEEEIATVTEEVGWLTSGDDDEAAQKVKQKATALLQKAARLKNDAAFAGQRKSLEKEARAAAGEVDNLDVIGHILEHGMADLLSNPRLEAAIRIQTRVAARGPAARKPRPASDKLPKYGPLPAHSIACSSSSTSGWGTGSQRARRRSRRAKCERPAPSRSAGHWRWSAGIRW